MNTHRSSSGASLSMLGPSYQDCLKVYNVRRGFMGRKGRDTYEGFNTAEFFFVARMISLAKLDEDFAIVRSRIVEMFRLLHSDSPGRIEIDEWLVQEFDTIMFNRDVIQGRGKRVLSDEIMLKAFALTQRMRSRRGADFPSD